MCRFGSKCIALVRCSCWSSPRDGALCNFWCYFDCGIWEFLVHLRHSVVLILFDACSGIFFFIILMLIPSYSFFKIKIVHVGWVWSRFCEIKMASCCWRGWRLLFCFFFEIKAAFALSLSSFMWAVCLYVFNLLALSKFRFFYLRCRVLIEVIRLQRVMSDVIRLFWGIVAIFQVVKYFVIGATQLWDLCFLFSLSIILIYIFGYIY